MDVYWIALAALFILAAGMVFVSGCVMVRPGIDYSRWDNIVTDSSEDEGPAVQVRPGAHVRGMASSAEGRSSQSAVGREGENTELIFWPLSKSVPIGNNSEAVAQPGRGSASLLGTQLLFRPPAPAQQGVVCVHIPCLGISNGCSGDEPIKELGAPFPCDIDPQLISSAVYLQYISEHQTFGHDDESEAAMWKSLEAAAIAETQKIFRSGHVCFMKDKREVAGSQEQKPLHLIAVFGDDVPKRSMVFPSPDGSPVPESVWDKMVRLWRTKKRVTKHDEVEFEDPAVARSVVSANKERMPRENPLEIYNMWRCTLSADQIRKGALKLYCERCTPPFHNERFRQYSNSFSIESGLMVHINLQVAFLPWLGAPSGNTRGRQAGRRCQGRFECTFGTSASWT